MAGQYLYVTKGYNGGWSAAATDLRRSAGGGTWLSVADGNKSAFYRTASGWRRWYSGINSDGTIAGYSYNVYSNPTTGISQVSIGTNGIVGSFGFGDVSWDPSGYPDNPDIEIYATKTSGLMAYVTGPSLNTWHTLNTTRTWTMTCSGGQASEVVLSVQFRHVPTAIVLATIPITLIVEYVSG